MTRALRIAKALLPGEPAWAIVLTSVAGSILMPRRLRYALYRLVGLGIETPHIRWGCTFTARDTRIGPGTGVNIECLFNGDGIRIGRECLIGARVTFTTAHHPPTTGGRFDPVSIYKPITVGDFCWIGAGALILPGTEIGEGCMISGGAVVSGTCEAGFVYAGVPAKRIGRVRAIPTT